MLVGKEKVEGLAETQWKSFSGVHRGRPETSRKLP